MPLEFIRPLQDERYGATILLLGAPGAGKTTALIKTMPDPCIVASDPQKNVEEAIHNANVDVQTGGVARCVAAAAITVLTAGAPTRICAAAAGQVKKLPSIAGDYWVFGEMDIDGEDADGANDVVYVNMYDHLVLVTVAGS